MKKINLILLAILPMWLIAQNNCLVFDGFEEHVSVPDAAALNITDAITIEAWVKGEGAAFSVAKRTTAEHDHDNPQFQVVGDELYYVWQESDGSNWQIWTAEMCTDGTGWTATKRTTSSYDKMEPQLQVVGTKIYYVWYEKDGSEYRQIWTAVMNTDGTGWAATKRTTSSFPNKYEPQLQVVGTKIYYVWYEMDASNALQIWTAEMNTDGTGWTAAKRTDNMYHKYRPQFQVVGTKIYYVWYESNNAKYQIWTAEMNTNGTAWSVTKRTNNSYHDYYPQLQVVGDKIYYIWREYGGSYSQIWTAEMNTDGNNWSAAQRTTSSFSKYSPQLQIVGDKIYYVWNEKDAADDLHIWTAEMDTDGTDWSATKRTTGLNHYEYCPQFQVVGAKIYYAWYGEDNMDDDQVWTAEIGSNILNKGDFYGIGIMGNTLKGFIDAGVDGFKYKASAISYTAGAVEEIVIGTNWRHVAMTYDKTNLTLFVNGCWAGESSFTEAINTNSLNLIIGDDFNGKIDEVRIWNDVRTEFEICDNMHFELDNPAGEANLVAYYKFNEVNVGVNNVLDFKGGHNGTHKNMTNANCLESTAPMPYFTVQNGNWNTDATWASGQNTPTNNSANIEIKHDVTMTTDEEAKDLAINSDKSLTISSDKSLTVNGTLTNNAGASGLIIESDATGTGSLIESSGAIATVSKYIPQYGKGTTGWHFLSSPVSNQNISTEFFNVATPVPTGADFLYFNEEHNYWINIKNGTAYNQGAGWENFSNEANPPFIVGKGYFAAYNTNVTKNFTGSLNFGDKASGTGIPALTYTTGQGEGWNLIGNPYSSAIDWDLGTWSRTNVDATVYVYDGTAGQYISWNGTSGGLTDGIIPPMQGFFVKANAASPSITIPQASRVHSTQNYYKSSETIPDLLVLKVAGNNFEDEIYINFNNDASNGFDSEFDAYKLYGTEDAPQFYSILPGEILSINVMPYSNEEVPIPLGLEVGEVGQYVISVKENTFWETVHIYLEDLKTGVMTNLKTTTKYTFSSNPNDNPERFILHFNGVNNIEEQSQENDDVRFFVYNNRLYIVDENMKKGVMQLYNMLGQPVMEKRYSETINAIDLNLSEGYYIVRIITEKISISGKIYIE
jgi:hypothetical protein